ncbi:amino acid deaminase [Shewanella waksmanii]|uniref:amino acid deaminase n=1 Tax=Shewanella waksmanii TaxID=213783 RepID=UPI0037354A8E
MSNLFNQSNATLQAANGAKNRIHKGLGDLATLEKGWQILKEQVSLPCATLARSAIENNLNWMQRFADKANVKLAPHGKTSMSPELFSAQIASGAWGMSVANAQQVVTAHHAGVKQIILANQLVGRRNFDIVATVLKQHQGKIYVFADSQQNLAAINDFFAPLNLDINVLIEMGVDNGRCGVRTPQQAEQLAQYIASAPALKLAGLAFYEGVIHGDDAAQNIAKFVAQNVTLAKQLANDLLKDKQTDTQAEFLITGAGSAWYDIVSEHISLANAQEILTAVIRPGCYLIHDTGIYEQAQQHVIERSPLACDIDSELINSLHIWAYVQSVPQPGMAIVGLGKRDVAFDAGLPTPEQHFRPSDTAPTKVTGDWQVTRIMDQHAMLSVPENSDIQPGDMICLSTSHPCLTLDKWRFVGIEDDNYCINQIIETHF